MKSLKNVNQMLKTLKLKGIMNAVDEIISEAEVQHISYLGFLNQLLTTELEDRSERRYRRNITGAHFPVIKEIADFEFGSVNGITRSQITQLLDFTWVDKHENVLFLGPPGLGNYV